MNRDFVEILAALSEAGADFLVIGAHAVVRRKRAMNALRLQSKHHPPLLWV